MHLVYVSEQSRCVWIRLKGTSGRVAFASFTGAFPVSCFLECRPFGLATGVPHTDFPTNNFPYRLLVFSLRGSIQSPRAKRLPESYLLSRLMGLRSIAKVAAAIFHSAKSPKLHSIPDCSTCSKFVALYPSPDRRRPYSSRPISVSRPTRLLSSSSNLVTIS